MNFKITAFSIAGLFLFVPQILSAGSITGTVKVKGLRSAENILVYLDKIEMPTAVDDKTHFVMNQNNLTFFPHILPIPIGSTVEFPNNDKVGHNVFSLSRTSPFNLGSYKPGESKSVRFDKPGIVELRCDVHAEMMAYIMVLKNPYVALTNSSGQFQIPDQRLFSEAGLTVSEDLPAGSYSLKIWHEKLRPVSQQVNVSENSETSIKLSAKRGPAGSVLYK
jgi:plastocyanin